MKPANKVALILLTFFFGAFGGHKMYVKKFGLAALYFLFFWTAIPSIVAFIEFIIYIIKSEEDIEASYPDTLSAGATAGAIIGAMILAGLLLVGGVVLMGSMMGWEQGVQ